LGVEKKGIYPQIAPMDADLKDRDQGIQSTMGAAMAVRHALGHMT